MRGTLREAWGRHGGLVPASPHRQTMRVRRGGPRNKSGVMADVAAASVHTEVYR